MKADTPLFACIEAAVSGAAIKVVASHQAFQHAAVTPLKPQPGSMIEQTTSCSKNLRPRPTMREACPDRRRRFNALNRGNFYPHRRRLLRKQSL